MSTATVTQSVEGKQLSKQRPAQIHLVPGHGLYFSSSYNAETGQFEAPRGGFGPPQSLNGAFAFHDTDPMFPKVNPHVDRSAYKTTNLQRGTAQRDPDRKTEERHVVGSGPLEEVASPFSRRKTARTLHENVQEMNAVNNTTIATGSAELVLEINNSRRIDPDVLSSIEEADREDTGIVAQDTVMPDAEGVVAKVILEAQGSVFSQGHDSTYGTQPLDESTNARLPDHLNHAKDEQVSRKTPRKTAPPTPNAVLRRSARIQNLREQSQSSQSLQSATPSLLGKRGHKSNTAGAGSKRKRAKH